MFKKIQMSFVFVLILLVSVVIAQETKDNTVSLESERIEQSVKKIGSAVRDMQEKNELFIEKLQQKTDIEIEKSLKSRENLLLSSQNSFSHSITIFNASMGIVAIVFTLVGLILAIWIYRDQKGWKKKTDFIVTAKDKAGVLMKDLEAKLKKVTEAEEYRASVSPKNISRKELSEEDKKALKAFTESRELSESLGVESESKDALHAYALELFHKGKHEEAIDVLEKLINLDQNDSVALFGKGVALAELGKTEKEKKAFREQAIEAYDMVLSIEGNDFASALYHKAFTFALMGNKKDALIFLKKATDLLPLFKKYAREEDYFESLWDDPEFIKVTSP